MLEQRELDVIGLGLVALGVFLALVLYQGFDGGRAGRGLISGLAWLLGVIRYAAPVAVVGAKRAAGHAPGDPLHEALPAPVACASSQA